MSMQGPLVTDEPRFSATNDTPQQIEAPAECVDLAASLGARIEDDGRTITFQAHVKNVGGNAVAPLSSVSVNLFEVSRSGSHRLIKRFASSPAPRHEASTPTALGPGDFVETGQHSLSW